MANHEDEQQINIDGIFDDLVSGLEKVKSYAVDVDGVVCVCKNYYNGVLCDEGINIDNFTETQEEAIELTMDFIKKTVKENKKVFLRIYPELYKSTKGYSCRVRLAILKGGDINGL